MTTTTIALMKIGEIAAEDAATETGRISFQLQDGTRFTFDPEHGPYVYNGEVIVPIVPDED